MILKMFWRTGRRYTKNSKQLHLLFILHKAKNDCKNKVTDITKYRLTVNEDKLR